MLSNSLTGRRPAHELDSVMELGLIRARIGRQCSLIMAFVTWSLGRRPCVSLVAALMTRCSRSVVDRLSTANRRVERCQCHSPACGSVIMVALWNRADHYIFALWLLLSFFFFISSPNLIRRRLDVCHTSTHGVTLVRFSDAGLKPAACGSLQTQDAKKSPKIAIWAPSHNFVGLYLRN